MWDTALGKKFNLFLQEFFAGINKIFILAGGLYTGLSFYGVWALSRYVLIS